MPLCKEKEMKTKTMIVTVLLAFVLFSAGCAAQDATNQPGEVTSVPTVTTNSGVATEAAGETAITPTGAVEEATTQGAEQTDTTPSVSTEDGTPAAEASGTAGIPQTGLGAVGLPDDIDEVMRVLVETGATLELGEAVENETLSVPGQILRINGEDVQIFTYDSVEELEAQASQVADEGDPEDEPHFYKLGNMLVRYVGSDPGVRDLLEDVLGAQVAGQ
jgi:hypothetical protein